jgi:hypothetical protein
MMVLTCWGGGGWVGRGFTEAPTVAGSAAGRPCCPPSRPSPSLTPPPTPQRALSALTAYSRHAMAFMSVCSARLPTLRCTKISPGARPRIWLAWWGWRGWGGGGLRRGGRVERGACVCVQSQGRGPAAKDRACWCCCGGPVAWPCPPAGGAEAPPPNPRPPARASRCSRATGTRGTSGRARIKSWARSSAGGLGCGSARGRGGPRARQSASAVRRRRGGRAAVAAPAPRERAAPAGARGG